MEVIIIPLVLIAFTWLLTPPFHIEWEWEEDEDELQCRT